jgi:hypothetical protein
MRSNPVPGILIPGVRFLADKGKKSPNDHAGDEDGGANSSLRRGGAQGHSDSV